MTTYDQALASIRRRAARGTLTPTERQRLRHLRDLSTKLQEDWARHQASLSVDRFQREQNRNGGSHIEDAAPFNLTVEAPRAPNQDRTGGRRGSGVWHHGVEQERQD